MMDDADDDAVDDRGASIDAVFKVLHLVLLLTATDELTCMSQNAFIHQ